MAEKASMLWVDLETTGLKPSEGEVILELALMLTDRWGDVIAGESWLVEDRTSQYKEAIARAKTHEIVGPMHEKSGLWKDLDNVEGPDFRQRGPEHVERMALDWLDNQSIPIGTLPMCGNSIRLDREFLEWQMPTLEKRWHYRMIDISTIKELCKRLNPRIFQWSPKETDSTDLPHRGYADLLASVEEYKYYVDNFLWTE